STFLFINTLGEQYMNESALVRAYGEALGKAYAEKGGIPNFSKKYTVFGQVYSGLDTFEAILATEALESAQPATDIIIEKAYISTYGEEN
ncbi:MAG: peptidylprolyl isomerase, partial [Oscillospiraceae bacterium]|nr:peptidylprolyl isomerase [Oscillospiraceae bacterium]